MAFGVSDELLPMIVPTAVYWVGSGFYSMMMGSMKHRLFTQEEEDAKNLVTRRQVLVGVLVNHALQMSLAALTFLGTRKGGDDGAGATPPAPSLLRLAWQLAVAVLFIDAWQYFWHRWIHENKFLYKHVHSMHHLVIAPYAYGAQYMHPIDSLVGDSLGSVLASLAAGMSTRTSTLFFTLLTLKGLDDHCGLWFPNSPTSRLLNNNSAWHALHHQHHGIKHNFSVYFLTTWDKLLGTYMPCIVEEREGGGYQLQAPAKDNGKHHD